MKTLLFKAEDRGTADYGWLKPNYYFSFAQNTYNAKINFCLITVFYVLRLKGRKRKGKKKEVLPHLN